MSGSVTVELRLANMSLNQLHAELGKLCFAGFGDSSVSFRCQGSGAGYSPWLGVKAFKPEAGEPGASGAKAKGAAR